MQVGVGRTEFPVGFTTHTKNIENIVANRLGSKLSRLIT